MRVILAHPDKGAAVVAVMQLAAAAAAVPVRAAAPERPVAKVAAPVLDYLYLNLPSAFRAAKSRQQTPEMAGPALLDKVVRGLVEMEDCPTLGVVVREEKAVRVARAVPAAAAQEELVWASCT